jgi:hypothetical protein
MTSAHIASVLGLDLKTLANWRYRGRHLRFYRMGSWVRYDSRDVIAFLERALVTVMDALLTGREVEALRRHLAGVLAVLPPGGDIAAFVAVGGLRAKPVSTGVAD